MAPLGSRWRHRPDLPLPSRDAAEASGSQDRLMCIEHRTCRESHKFCTRGEELAGIKAAQAEPFQLVLLRATDTDAKPRHPSAFHEGPMIVSTSAIVAVGSGPFARAPTFSSTCATLRKPGMGNVRGEVAQIQPKAP